MAERKPHVDVLVEPKETLPQGGYVDELFLEPPDETSSLRCPVCFLVLREPHLLSCCGSHLCQVCITFIERKQQPCPYCREVEFTTMLNKKTRGEILGLKVRCVNNVVGCDWTGELGDQQRHIAGNCEYLEEECQYGCGERNYRRLLRIHEERECSKRSFDVKLTALSKALFDLEKKYAEEITNMKRQSDQDKNDLYQKLQEQQDQLEALKKKVTKQDDIANGKIRPFYRYYRENSKDHFYTTNVNEIGTTTAGTIGNHGYRCEGKVGYLFTMQELNTEPLYRYWQREVSDHFYTTNEHEIGTTTPGEVKKGYNSEGIAGYCYTTEVPGTLPLYRYWSSKTHDHFYTTNPNEIDMTTLQQSAYIFEGIQCYLLDL